MADTNTSQAQQNTTTNTTKQGPFQAFGIPFQVPTFDPTAFTSTGIAEMWTKAATEQQTRLAAMFDEYAKVEEKGMAEARRAIEEMTRLSLATVNYAHEMSANLRKQALDLSKKTVESTHVEAKKA